MNIDKSKTFLIVGLGLIGGSYARILKHAGYTVYGIDHDLKTVDYALEHKIVDKASTQDLSLISMADYIIVALYPLDTLNWIIAHQAHMQSHTMITDVSGVKSNIVGPIQADLREDLEFIASHPMAGKEVAGIENSSEHLFLKANFILCPTEKNTQSGIQFAEDLAKLLNFKNIVQLSVSQHDEMIGFLSQLTHVIAVSLMNTNGNPHLKEYTGDSFRDLTRIAKINEQLWSELFTLNKDNLVLTIDAFMEQMTDFKETLINNDLEKMKDLMRQSTLRRKHFDE